MARNVKVWVSGSTDGTLRNNHSDEAKRLMHDTVLTCARLYYGVDE